MSEQFKEQGGAATMDPSPLRRWLNAKTLTWWSSVGRVNKQRSKIEHQRIKDGHPHVVEYFHQLDDGYSHLAAQVLPALAKRYNVQLDCHLVTGPSGKNVAEPELLKQLSRYDAFHVAAEYGLQFPEHQPELDQNLVALATSILAALDSAGFIEHATEVGLALWANDKSSLESMEQKLGSVSPEQAEHKVTAGTNRRHELRHYSGAMFYYAGEWFWGVDRLYHLEKRLAELGADNQATSNTLIPRPALKTSGVKDDGSLTLEVYVSLRSPYSAIVFDRAVKLAKDTGVTLVVRPVLPMVMRGVPATMQKGQYIFMDAGREARAEGVPYGKIYDPIGEPVRRCYSLYPWACKQGKGSELISSFLSMAFAQGVNTNNNRGFKKVVENAGLDWSKARTIVGQSDWQSLLEENRLAMYEAGLWGVPSFRLLDKNGEQLLALWGQDRLWLFAREIQRRLAAR
ncbi:MAG: 2-hydroxychromene-2-carboxylate isomerase [Halieaceae bacterium]|jgi:2-hydroxychromene-2-carboxylate isomerase